MGCTSSNEVPPNKAKIIKKSQKGTSPLKNTSLNAKQSRSPSINSRIS